MSIFDQLGQQTPTNPMQMMQQLRANPMAMLQRAGLSIPTGMTDPQQMVNYLLQSGQVSNAKYQQAMQMARRR